MEALLLSSTTTTHHLHPISSSSSSKPSVASISTFTPLITTKSSHKIISVHSNNYHTRSRMLVTATSKSVATETASSAAAVAVPTEMKWWLYDEYGGVDVLKFSTKLTVPQVKDDPVLVKVIAAAHDQVLVKVIAAALNPVDFKRRFGKFQATDSPLSTVPGYDVVGVVVKVGKEVKGLKVGVSARFGAHFVSDASQLKGCYLT